MPNRGLGATHDSACESGLDNNAVLCTLNNTVCSTKKQNISKMRYTTENSSYKDFYNAFDMKNYFHNLSAGDGLQQLFCFSYT